MRFWPRVWFFLIMAAGVSAGVWAQNAQNTGSTGAAAGSSAVVPKPVRKPDQVLTNDPIALLAVRRGAPKMASPVASSRETAPADEGQRAAEITLLGKEIKSRQTRITLLMRLFVQDEQAFLKNPSGPADPVAEERRRYEQDELRWETAELAKAQATLESLKSENRK